MGCLCCFHSCYSVRLFLKFLNAFSGSGFDETFLGFAPAFKNYRKILGLVFLFFYLSTLRGIAKLNYLFFLFSYNKLLHFFLLHHVRHKYLLPSNPRKQIYTFAFPTQTYASSARHFPQLFVHAWSKSPSSKSLVQ